MKNLKMLIILLSILIIGIIIVLIIMNMQNTNINNKIPNYTNTYVNNIQNVIINGEQNENTKLTSNTSIQQVKEESMLHCISKSITKYFNYIREGNIQAISELGGNNMYNIANNVKYTVKEAYNTENEYISKYYTYGILTIANGNFTASEQEVYLIIYVNLENNAYKIETITKEEFLVPQKLEEQENMDLQKGLYNNFEYEYINNAQQMELYLEDYSFQIFNNTQRAYDLLEEEYKEKRFQNTDEFIKYLNEKENQLRNIKVTQYIVEQDGENTIYKGTDENGNYYYIKKTGYMEYTVILDNYTLQADYSNGSTEEKIEKNTEKFILMLNSADYSNAYNLLEPTFKANNFQTEQDFINYIKSNWYERNIIASKEVTEEGLCVVTIKQSIATTSNKIIKQFKVTLGEEMNFTIEFDI